MESEYHYYIFPEITTWKHNANKVCQELSHRIPNPSPDLEELYTSNQLCPKCAFYCGFWYDIGKASSLLHHFKIKVRPTHPKSPLSLLFIDKMDLYDLDQNQDPCHFNGDSDLKILSIKKLDECYQMMLKKRGYKEADFAAHTQTIQILGEIRKQAAKYLAGSNSISIIQEIIQ